jgi:hypothetical protein
MGMLRRRLKAPDLDGHDQPESLSNPAGSFPVETILVIIGRIELVTLQHCKLLRNIAAGPASDGRRHHDTILSQLDSQGAGSDHQPTQKMTPQRI